VLVPGIPNVTGKAPESELVGRDGCCQIRLLHLLRNGRSTGEPGEAHAQVRQ
jgi:hypothetical protein